MRIASGLATGRTESGPSIMRTKGRRILGRFSAANNKSAENRFTIHKITTKSLSTQDFFWYPSGPMGTLRKQHGSWHYRYYVAEVGADGLPRRRQVDKVLARICDDYRSPKDLKDLIDGEDAKANRGSAAEGSLTLSRFHDDFFLPAVLARRRASTHKFYRDLFDNHLRDRVGDIRLRDFQTVDAQRVLDDIDLSHQSLQRIKTGMSALFSHALRVGFISGHNPVHEAKPEGRRSDFEGHAYTVEDVEFMLSRLTGVARLAVATAAFTGLRLAELRGLQWTDYTDGVLYVRRSVWRRTTNATKTPESRGIVPVIKPLRLLLDEHKKDSEGTTWVFEGERGFSLTFDNLANREIRPALGDRWRGWKPFRSGVATVLFGIGVDVEVAALILRHADSTVTRRHYIKLQSVRDGAAAMKRFERSLQGAVKGQRKRQSS